MIIGRQSVVAQTPSILLNLIPSTIPYLPWQDVAVAPLTFIPRVLCLSNPSTLIWGLGSQSRSLADERQTAHPR